MVIHIFLSIFALVGTTTSIFAANVQDEQAAFAKFPPIIKTLCEMSPNTTHALALKQAVLECNKKSISDVTRKKKLFNLTDATISRSREVNLSPQTTIALVKDCLNSASGFSSLVSQPARFYDPQSEQSLRWALIKKMPQALQEIYQQKPLYDPSFPEFQALSRLTVIAHLYNDSLDKQFVVDNVHNINLLPYFLIYGSFPDHITLSIKQLVEFLPKNYPINGLPDEFTKAVTKQSE